MGVKASLRDPGEREFELTDEDFAYITEYIHQRTGIVLGAHKRDMVYARLAKRIRRLRLDTFKDYIALLGGKKGEEEVRFFVNALTTNLTRFFREGHHFEHLADELFPVLERRVQEGHPRRLRIWSAGSSSGEEPYTIAMTLREHLADLQRWDAKVLATDLDTNMVKHGADGLFTEERIETIPPELRTRYVKKVAGSGKENWRMAESLRSLIWFKQLNLLGPWPMKGPFDAIFCRNVVIYFDKPTQQVLFDRYADLLADHGYLYVGHSENLFNVTDRFKLVGRSAYRKVR